MSHFSLYTRFLLLILFWIFLEMKNVKILLCKHTRSGSRLVLIVGLIEKLDRRAFVKAGLPLGQPFFGPDRSSL